MTRPRTSVAARVNLVAGRPLLGVSIFCAADVATVFGSRLRPGVEAVSIVQLMDLALDTALVRKMASDGRGSAGDAAQALCDVQKKARSLLEALGFTWTDAGWRTSGPGPGGGILSAVRSVCVASSPAAGLDGHELESLSALPDALVVLDKYSRSLSEKLKAQNPSTKRIDELTWALFEKFVPAFEGAIGKLPRGRDKAGPIEEEVDTFRRFAKIAGLKLVSLNHIFSSELIVDCSSKIERIENLSTETIADRISTVSRRVKKFRADFRNANNAASKA